MRSLLLLLTLFSVIVATYAASFGQQLLSDEYDAYDIPDNLKLCGDKNDLLEVQDIKIDPNPPRKGEDMHVEFKGYLKEQVGEGAQIDVIVKYGAVRLLHKVFDLCEQAPQVDKECPIEKGEVTANKTVTLPKDIPPGRYTVQARLTTQDERDITCLIGQMTFKL